MCRRVVSVRLSDCLSCSCIVSKPVLKLFSRSGIDPPFLFSVPNVMAIFQLEPRVECRNHFFDSGVGCVAQLVERRSLTCELSLSCARPAGDG